MHQNLTDMCNRQAWLKYKRKTNITKHRSVKDKDLGRQVTWQCFVRLASSTAKSGLTDCSQELLEGQEAYIGLVQRVVKPGHLTIFSNIVKLLLHLSHPVMRISQLGILVLQS